MTTSTMRAAGWYEEGGDNEYLRNVLRHRDMEFALSDKIPFWIVFWMWFRAAFFGSLAGFVVLGLDIVATKDIVNSIEFGVATAVVVYLLFFFRSKFNQPIGEWRVLLADRAHCVDSVYSKIKGAIERRGMPLAVVARRMLNDRQNRTCASRLIIQDGQYTVYVSVFPYGSSLYLGWSMWRRRSCWTLFKRWIADAIRSLFGLSDLLRVMLRADRPRAMREGVHFACREGLKVAVTETFVPVEYGFSNGLPPIEHYSQAASATPSIPAMPSAPPLPPPPPSPVAYGDSDQNAATTGR